MECQIQILLIIELASNFMPRFTDYLILNSAVMFLGDMCLFQSLSGVHAKATHHRWVE
jgi:hypothetical protein